MKTKLSGIADIKTGYNFRTSLHNNPKGNIFVLQAKNIETDQEISDLSSFTKIADDNIKSPTLQYDDIVLVARGAGIQSFRSTVIKSRENIIPSSSVHSIRIISDIIIPEYLSLYLNSEAGQKKIIDIASGGSYIKNISRKDLMELEIYTPSLETQKTIINLHENIEKQKAILRKKQEINEKILDYVFISLIK